MSLRDEVRSLQRAARDGNKEHLKDWLVQYSDQVQAEHERNFNQQLEKERTILFESFVFLMTYTLKMSEETLQQTEKSLNEFISDFIATLELLGKADEYTMEDYRKQLADEGIEFSNINKVDVYKTLFPNIDSDLFRYVSRKNHRKISLILAEPELTNQEFEFFKTLSEKSKTVLTDSLLDYGDFEKPSDIVLDAFNRIDKEKILLSDEVYIITEEDGKLSSRLLLLEAYAKEHNKKIIYKKVSQIHS